MICSHISLVQGLVANVTPNSISFQILRFNVYLRSRRKLGHILCFGYKHNVETLETHFTSTRCSKTFSTFTIPIVFKMLNSTIYLLILITIVLIIAIITIIHIAIIKLTSITFLNVNRGLLKFCFPWRSLMNYFCQLDI